MKNKLTRKLMLSAFTLLFAVISLGASTYAWFVMSEDAKVESFTGTVTAGESGLEIAVGLIPDSLPDAKDLVWRSTAIDIAKELGWIVNGEVKHSIAFDALQNNNGSDEFDPAEFAGLTADKEGETPFAQINENYIGFRLYFRLADADDQSTDTVYLTDYDLKANEPTNGWYVNKIYQDATGTDFTVGDTPKYNVKDAARIAFVTKDDTKVYEVEDAPAQGTNSLRSAGIGKNGAYSYYKAVLGEDALKDYPDQGEYYTCDTLPADVSDFLIGTIQGTNYVYVDVYVWIEGWDQECINAIFEQTLEVALKFSLNNGRQED